MEYKPYVIDSGYLFPPSLADFLGEDDEVHIFREVTEHLDTNHLDSVFNGMGQRPYHPRMLLRLLMWGMANRVISTRKIETLSGRDVSFIYLAGGQRPDYRTLARFRRRNADEIKGLFKETVFLCARLGMVSLGHIALDGTKVKASSSRYKAMSYGRMKEEEKRLDKEIEELMRQAEEADESEDRAFGKENNGYKLPKELQRREGRLEKIRRLKGEIERERREEQGLGKEEDPLIEDREQRSFADKDARMMLMKRGGFDYGYNAQVCIAEGAGVIVAADLSNKASDTGHLPGLVAEIRDLREELGKGEGEQTEVTADGGYFSADNIEQEGEGIELLIASGREGKEKGIVEKIYSVERFEYLKGDDTWRCPDGRKLVRKRKQAVKGRPPLRCYECPDCGGCRLRAYCLKSGKENRTLLVKKRQLIKAEMRTRLKDPGKRAIYGKRKWVVEQGIGQIKAGMGFREVSVRGKKFVRSQWYFICAIYNIMKVVRHIARMRKRGLVPAIS